MIFEGTFDTTGALSGMYLWLIFGYLAALLNCDLQRFLKQNPLCIHAFGIIAFFFLFTILDSKNKTSLGLVWLKTFFIYLLFLLMTKSKWYFVVPVLALLLIDQSFKKDVAIKEANGKDVTQDKVIQQNVTNVLTVLIILLVIVGTSHYMYIQKAEYGKDFSVANFFLKFGNCKDAPT